jgi:hypothetical protein
MHGHLLIVHFATAAISSKTLHRLTFPKSVYSGMCSNQDLINSIANHRLWQASEGVFSGMLPPRKPKNTEVRPREYLTEHEIDALNALLDDSTGFQYSNI